MLGDSRDDRRRDDRCSRGQSESGRVHASAKCAQAHDAHCYAPADRADTSIAPVRAVSSSGLERVPLTNSRPLAGDPGRDSFGDRLRTSVRPDATDRRCSLRNINTQGSRGGTGAASGPSRASCRRVPGACGSGRDNSLPAHFCVLQLQTDGLPFGDDVLCLTLPHLLHLLAHLHATTPARGSG